MAKTSIERRLFASIIIAQLLLAAGLVDVTVFVLRNRLRVAFDIALRSRAMRLAALVHYGPGEGHPLEFEKSLLPHSLDTSAPDLFEVSSDRHEVIARSAEWPEKQDVLPPRGDRWIATQMVDGIAYRALRIEHIPVFGANLDPNGPVYLTVMYASPVAPVMRSVRDVVYYIATGSAILVLITGGFSLWALRRSLRPLSELAASASAVSLDNWSLSPPEEALETKELEPLTRAMTSMLEGLHRAFTQQREFLANAAHELKTPVAVLKSTLQSLAHRRRTVDEYHAGLQDALEDLSRLETLVHSMLRVARAEQWAVGNLRRDLEAVDVGMTCQIAMERVQPVAEQRRVSIDLHSDGAVRMVADPEDLELVWSNLLENAIRFSPVGSTVRVRLRALGGKGSVEVADDGPGIPESELPHIFERFHRGDSSRARTTGGYGLGLAIAKALVEAYGGEIVPQSSPGRGTRMVVVFPLAHSRDAAGARVQ